MTGKQSFIIISILLIVLIVFVYIFSTPSRPVHVAPVGTDGSATSLPVIDSLAKGDSITN